MCTTLDTIDPKDASEKLARLMERGLGYPEGYVDPVALRLFLIAYWDRASIYAHAIHHHHVKQCKNTGEQ